MLNVQRNQIALSVVFACVLSLGLMNPGIGLAGQEKKDVCHLTGNRAYHVITIPEPAWQTHFNHGDAGVGESVPGHEDFVFDDDCNLVEPPVSCPCGNALDVFNIWDGIATGEPTIFECSLDGTNNTSLEIDDAYDSGVDVRFRVRFGDSCAYFVTNNEEPNPYGVIRFGLS